jgi:hypothetical protein
MSESNPQGAQPNPSPTPPPPPASSPPAAGTATGDSTGSTTTPVQRGATVTLSPGLVLGIVAIAAIVVGMFIKESDAAGAPSVNLWDRTSAPLWAIVAIVAAVATLLPALTNVLNVPARLAWTIAAVGAGYLVFWWVLFVLPIVSLNVSFLVTLGVGAAVAAVWTSADNPYRDRYSAS